MEEQIIEEVCFDDEEKATLMISSKSNFSNNIHSDKNFESDFANGVHHTDSKSAKKSSKHGQRKGRRKDADKGEVLQAGDKGRRPGVKKTVRFVLPNTLHDDTPRMSLEETASEQKAKKTHDAVSHKNDLTMTRHLPSGWQTKWTSTCKRWVARIEHLVEMDMHSIRLLPATPPLESLVRFCDNQRHLLLGNGPDFSSVYMGVLSDGTEVAVKKINIKRAPLLADMNVAKALLSAPASPSLTRIHFITRDKTHFYVVKDLVDYSLKQELKRRHYLPQPKRSASDISHMCHEIAKATRLLHDSNLIHMALKPENVLVNASGQAISLTDYGIHARAPSKQQQKCESSHWQCWLPSEILANRSEKSKNKPMQMDKYTTASDVSSLGMLFYYLMTEGDHPFGDHENAPDACVRNISRGSYNLKAISDPLAHHLIQNMIFKEPEKRLTINQVCDHPYFWTDADKNQYVSLVAKVAITGCQLQKRNCIEEEEDCCCIFNNLKKDECAIMASCVDLDGCQVTPIETDSIEGLLHCISKVENAGGDLAVFWQCVPGLLLSMYIDVPLPRLSAVCEELEQSGKLTRLCGSLLPTLSTDSGVAEPIFPEMSLDLEEISGSKAPSIMNHDHHVGRFTSADDGIDILSPVPSSSIDDGVFFANSLSPTTQPSGWNISEATVPVSRIQSPGSCGSSVDNHFEFDRGDCSQRVSECENDADAMEGFYEGMPLWTDIDELD